MLMSNLAMMDLGLRRRSVVDRLRDVFRHADEKHGEFPADQELRVPPDLEVIPAPDVAEEESVGDYRWRRHPQLLNGSGASAISDEERLARRTAVRGLYCAHNGEIEEAFLHFVHALDESTIDLTELPSFWQMPRAAILSAADAYEFAGMHREAAVIQARVRTELRPRNVVPMKRPAPNSSPRRTANGG
jgi:hypothetical protein